MTDHLTADRTLLAALTTGDDAEANMIPMSMRWPADVLARATEVSKRTGLNRSAVLRLAVVEGLPALERLGR